MLSNSFNQQLYWSFFLFQCYIAEFWFLNVEIFRHLEILGQQKSFAHAFNRYSIASFAVFYSFSLFVNGKNVILPKGTQNKSNSSNYEVTVKVSRVIQASLQDSTGLAESKWKGFTRQKERQVVCAGLRDVFWREFSSVYLCCANIHLLGNLPRYHRLFFPVSER